MSLPMSDEDSRAQSRDVSALRSLRVSRNKSKLAGKTLTSSINRQDVAFDRRDVKVKGRCAQLIHGYARRSGISSRRISVLARCQNVDVTHTHTHTRTRAHVHTTAQCAEARA